MLQALTAKMATFELQGAASPASGASASSTPVRVHALPSGVVRVERSEAEQDLIQRTARMGNLG